MALAFLTTKAPMAGVVMAGLTHLGFMKFVAWWFGQFVTWSHQMRLLWRKLRAEPNPAALQH